jgi:hypothetical protein
MRRALYLGLLAAISGPAVAQQQPRGGEPQDITVTGVRIQDYRDRLAACLARNCPVNEDVDATLALAEALLLTGEYRDARSFVRASLGRNRNQARSFPEPVSDLHRANARLARHIGLDREARTSAFDTLNALQAGIPREDHRHFTARFEIAETQMLSGNFPGARRELGRLIQAARAAGRLDVVTIAELRDLWYEMIAFPASDARGRLIRWSRLTAPADRMRATGAKLMLARVYRSDGDIARADALLAEIGRGGASAQRRLLHSPPYQLAQQEMRLEGDQDLLTGVAFGNTLNRVTENYEDKWIDVGFWVGPDGRVSGLEVVRRGANDGWAQPLLESIRGRTYTTGPEASYRLERYSYTATYETVSGSRMQRRSPAARVEYLDLTVAEDPPRPAPGGPSSN